MMRVLFVDDEQNVLDAVRRQLRKRVELFTAPGGNEGLEVLAGHGPFALVVSDMRMPGMDGAAFLAQVRARWPDTVRMILSGQAELESTIAAVNDGYIFRFLTKPCSAEALWKAVEMGVSQYRLITAERELLEKTIHGMAETLTDILGMTNPVARERTGRVRQYADAIAGTLGFAMPWDLRLALLLSQIGCITLPAQILDKLCAGAPLSDEERQLYARHPAIAAQLIGRIPRLESVASMIGRQQATPDLRNMPGEISAWDQQQLASLIVAVATGLDERMAAGDQPAAAIRALEAALPGIPPVIVAAMRGMHEHSAYMDIQFMRLGDLRLGMVLDEDVVTSEGDTLIARGEEVTRTLLEKARTSADDTTISRQVRVLVPA